MTAALMGLMVAIFTLLGTLGVTVERQPLAGSPYERDSYGYQRVGAMACWPDRHPVVYYSDALPVEGEVHEYVHALDCADDGLLNGSVCDSKRPATYVEALRVVHETRPGVLSSYWVWYAWAGTLGPAPVEVADGEWCATMATLTGGLTNQEAR